MAGVNEFLSQAIPRVRRPSRYIGGEWNSVVKDGGSGRLSFLLAYPDGYEVGMANLGLQILHQILNGREDVRAERAFAPWLDMEQEMRSAGVPLFSLETRSPIASFDVIGFSLQHELNYTNVLNMLDLGHIPLLAQERGATFPLVCGGGPCTVNPEPLADFFDFFFLGEAEEAILEIAEVVLAGRKSSLARTELLLRLARIPGVYVPQFYAPRYDADGHFIGTHPTENSVPPVVARRVVANLDAVTAGQRPVVPFAEVAQGHLSVEIARGCPHGCRFCQAGYTIRPLRRRSADAVVNAAQEGLDSTGLDSLSLLALNCPDHPHLAEIVSRLAPRLGAQRVGLSFPSSRVDSFPLELAASVPGKRSGLTLAPEAGSERLRKVIRKRISRPQLLDLAGRAYRSGWNTIKLYYMIGLPTETDLDLEAIGEEVRQLLAQAPGRAKVNLTLSTFIPKPHTPFQWERQQDIIETEARQRTVLAGLRNRKAKVSWHDPRQSLLEGVLARGDRELGKVLLRAQGRGLRMDAWSEVFDWEGWQQAFSDAGVEPERYLRARQEEDALPWDHLDAGVAKSRLLRERHAALAASEAPVATDTASPPPGAHPFTSAASLPSKPENQRPKLIPYQVTYGKIGDLRFLSPLELQAAFIKGLRRAALPLAFSSGFHPKPRVSFGRALRVGTESDVLAAVFVLTSEIPPEEIKDRLGRCLPAEMPVRMVQQLAEKEKRAALHADWETALIQVQVSKPIDDIERALQDFLSRPNIPVARRRPVLGRGGAPLETRNSKSETVSLDAKLEIRCLQLASLEAPEDSFPGDETFWLKVSMGMRIPALSPEDVAAALLEYLGGGHVLRVRYVGFGRDLPAGEQSGPQGVELENARFLSGGDSSLPSTSARATDGAGISAARLAAR